MPKTVLQIIPALGTGGAEQACVDIAAALVARGDRAMVVTSGGRRTAEIEAAGGSVALRNVKSKNPARILRNALWLAQLIRREGVDIVHARSRAPAWSAFLACRLTGTPFVTTFHAAYKFRSPLKRAYNSVMAKGARVIAISEFVAEHVRQNYGVGPERLRVINRGINLAKFARTMVSKERVAALSAAWGAREDETIVLVPARLSPIKGQRVVIDALAALEKAGKPVPLTLLVGDDQGRVAYTQSLREAIRDAGLEGRVRLVGPCADMPAAYALADLVLVPSIVPEGFGRVAVEAMAMGVLVLASDLGGTRETVLDGRGGWRVPAGDVSAWAEALGRALSLKLEEYAIMADAARRQAEAQFDLRQMLQKTLAVYDELAR